MQPSSAEIAAFLAEDIGSGDLTANLIAETVCASASVVTREAMVICGQAWFAAVFAQLDPEVSIEWLCQEGDWLAANAVICRL